MHAIGKGVVVCEIQQSSNCTYRLYDYDRTDRYGNRRQLHVEKALEVMDHHQNLPQFQDETVVKDTYTCRILSRCKYFEMRKLSDLRYGVKLPAYSDSFSSLVCVKGSGTLYKQDEKMQFSVGDSFFVPCSGEKIRAEGDCELILTHI